MQVRKTIAALRFAHTGDVDDPEDLEEDSLFGPIVDAPSERIENLVSDLLWSPSETDATVDAERSYTVDADMNISLAPTIGGGSGGDESNESAATTLVNVAVQRAASVEASAGIPTSDGLFSQLRTGSRTGVVVADRIEEHLDDADRADPGTAGRTAQILEEKLRQ